MSSTVFAMCGKLGVQKGDCRIHLTDPSVPTKVFPIDHAYLGFFFHFFSFIHNSNYGS